MFERLMNNWHNDSLVKAAFRDTNAMLKKAQHLFLDVSRLFLKNQPIDYDIYAVDKEINAMEIEVRRKVLEHLSVSPKQDLVASLVLTTIISDIERIGDFAKNVFELHQIYPKVTEDEKYLVKLKSIADNIRQMFELTLVAFEFEDKEKASNAMDLSRAIKQNCERIIRDLAADDSLKAREALGLGLFSRYIKRVTSHLANVVTSVLNPFERIGYYLEKDL